jgi:hypothetical protein
MSDGNVKLNLINSFDNVINGFVASRTLINTDFSAKTESIFVTNFTNFSFTKNDTGDGTDWVTSVTNDGNNIFFAISENASGSTRTMTITLTNTDTLQEIEITIVQTATIITADNNVITADSNLITSDNG